MLAMVVEGPRGREYLAPGQDHETIAASAEPNWTPHGELPNDPRSFWAVQYGLTSYASLFSDRQMVALDAFAQLVEDVRAEIAVQAGSDSEDLGEPNNPLVETISYADAIATYLAFAVDRMATYGSTLCKWLTKDNALAPSIPQQGIAMSYDYAEGNFLAKSSASVIQCISVVSACIEQTTPVSPGSVTMADARFARMPYQPVLATDPPYYDNIPYADCSDFFYVWMWRSLREVWPTLFRRLQTPKEEELVATPYRHGGTEQAHEFFMKGMRQALGNLLSQSEDAYPSTIFYAFKQTEDGASGVTSRGWASFLQGVVDSGVSVDGTWPLRTELTSALKTNLNSLASSVVLVCRKRSPDAPVVTRAEFIRVLRRELPSAIDAIRKAGVGPIDMQQSVIGPGMHRGRARGAGRWVYRKSF